MAGLHGLADAAVFPYHEMFSSGSVLLAISRGLPVIVPSGSAGAELAAPPAIAPIGIDGTAAALRAVRRGDRRVRRQTALTAAARFDWKTVGNQTARVYRLARQQRAGQRLAPGTFCR
ncbi:MAG: glycosyltransferase [Acetobacteraceae bacterium]|nr:glycosyltransferase [Acetobacteraceae bacterium]